MSFARFGVAEQVTRADQAGETQRARLESRSRQDRVVEALFSKSHDQAHPIGVSRKQRASFPAVLSLLVGVDGIDSRIPLKNRFVVSVDERCDMGARKTLAQREYERSGADQIADVSAADHQDSRRVPAHNPPK